MRLSVFLGTLLLSVVSGAEYLVECKQANRGAEKVIEYVFKETQSSRLNSGVVYTKDNVGIAFNQSAVAQYKTTASELFLILDTVEENILVKMSAKRHRHGKQKSKYEGKLIELDAVTGIPVRTVRIRCDIVGL